MIIPSIDIMNGRAVQLRQGRALVLDGGHPLERLEAFAVAGEVAVVDLDAALGRGSNRELIEGMVRRAPCRVGGGIRDLESARRWLDAGAWRIVVGTAATPAFLAELPRERVIAAVDARAGQVMVDGWRQSTGRDLLETVRALAPDVGGFLVTQVEFEGEMRGFDQRVVEQVVAAAGDRRVTAAGGISTAAEVAALDRIGADAQVGMALYSGRLDLACALAAPLRAGPDGLWPTVVCDEAGQALGLAWSNLQSLGRAVAERRGIYWSRSRRAVWVKGQTSGNRQTLVRVEVDCDRDALRFVVRQEGSGFCHAGTRTCWGEDHDLGWLERIVASRRSGAPASSNTARLFADPHLLAAKLTEEAAELAAAPTAGEAAEEAADLMYFTLVALAARGATLADVRRVLARRALKVTRRPMRGKVPG